MPHCFAFWGDDFSELVEDIDSSLILLLLESVCYWIQLPLHHKA